MCPSDKTHDLQLAPTALETHSRAGQGGEQIKAGYAQAELAVRRLVSNGVGDHLLHFVNTCLGRNQDSTNEGMCTQHCSVYTNTRPV